MSQRTFMAISYIQTSGFGDPDQPLVGASVVSIDSSGVVSPVSLATTYLENADTLTSVRTRLAADAHSQLGDASATIVWLDDRGIL